jgi:hypothetical protein
VVQACPNIQAAYSRARLLPNSVSDSAKLTVPLRAISEIVHDIDLKDGKFAREETSGIAHLITGLTMANKSDDDHMSRGAAVFDDLYEYFRKKRS